MRRLFWGALVLFFLACSLAPTFYEFFRQNDLYTNRQFELVHNYFTDYNFYLSRIRQGREGARTVTEKYTSESHSGSFIHIMYLYMGKIGARVGVPIERIDAMYHTARIVLAATLLFLIAYAAKKAFEKQGIVWQVMTFFLAVTASSWPILVFHKGEWRFGGYMPWWSIMDSLQRITFIPHMLAGQALIVMLLLSLSDRTVMKKPYNWVFLGFMAFLLGIVFPPGLVFAFAAWGVFIVLDLFYRLPFKTKNDAREWIALRLMGPAIAGVISAPTLLYLSLALNVYPWKRIVDYAILHVQPFVLGEYLLSVGPLLVLGTLGGLLVLMKRERRLLIFVAWAIAWLACIVIFKYIPQESPLRFTEMLPQVPLAVLCAYLFFDLYQLLRKHAVILVFPIILVLLGLGQLYSSWGWQKEFIDQKITASQPPISMNNYIMYPSKDFIAAMVFLEHSTSRTSIVLSQTTAGNYIPVYAGNTVYVGHANTIDTEHKEQKVKAFFGGTMGRWEAEKLLEDNNIEYVFFGPQEMADGKLFDLADTYPFLTQIYENNTVRLYKR